jgi:TPR repeat protein
VIRIVGYRVWGGIRRRLRAGPMLVAMSLVFFGSSSLVTARADDAPGAAANDAYRRGHDLYEQKNYAEALRWYRVAADHGDALAQVGIGNLYAMGLGLAQDYAEALRWFRLSAAQGNSEAEDQLGFFYLSGWGVRQDYVQALSWFRKAADQGNEIAERNIGMMFLQGLGVTADRAEAIRWFRKAAAKGDDDSKDALKYLGAE